MRERSWNTARASGVTIPQFFAPDFGVVFKHRIIHAPAPEWRAEVDVPALPGQVGAPERRPRGFAQHVLGEIHDFLIARIRLIQLEHGELGVVPGRHAFVAEIPVDLVDALETADDQALEIQLGGNAQVELQIERVVMGHERSRRRPSRNHVHHRRLDFHEPARLGFQPLAHETDCPRTQGKRIARFGRDDQIDISLAVALLDVGQAMPLVRQRAQRLGQQAQAIDLDRQLAGARAHQFTLGTNDVADVPALERLVGFSQGRALQEQLDLPAHVLEGDEAGLAHDAPREDASCHANPARQCGNRLGGAGVDIGEFRLQVAGKCIDAEIVRVGVAVFAQAVQFLATLGNQFVLVRRNGGRGNRRLCRIGRNAVGHFRGSLQGCRE